VHHDVREDVEREQRHGQGPSALALRNFCTQFTSGRCEELQPFAPELLK
jgi:hypothetical protein